MSYWQNYKKFFVSFQKSMCGAGRDGGQRLGLRLSAQARCAGLRRPAGVRADAPGQDERLCLPGLQPAAVVPEPQEDHRGAVASSSSSSSWIRWIPRRRGSGRITANTTTSTRRRSRPKSFELPTTCFAEDEGSLTNSGRWLQWHWAGAARLRARPSTTPGSWRRSIMRLKTLYRQGRRRVPRSDPQSELALRRPGRARRRTNWPRRSTATRSTTCTIPPTRPRSCWRRASRSSVSRSLRDDGNDGLRLLDLFRLLQRGRQQHGAPRQHRSRRTGGICPNWAWSWPVNRRILYNRASCDRSGNPWIRAARTHRVERQPDGSGFDVPDIAPTVEARTGRRSVHHEPGRRRPPVHARH